MTKDEEDTRLQDGPLQPLLVQRDLGQVSLWTSSLKFWFHKGVMGFWL
jgi:hypothetical protein